jgi:hypothetical protein
MILEVAILDVKVKKLAEFFIVTFKVGFGVGVFGGF